MPNVDLRRITENDRTLDDVLELSNVAGPVVAVEDLEGLIGEALDAPAVLLGITAKEEARERPDVRTTVAERRS